MQILSPMQKDCAEMPLGKFANSAENARLYQLDHSRQKLCLVLYS
jgi:hypothetical protein